MSFHQHVPPNRFGRDFVIGDLHGHTALLDTELRKQFFTPGRDRLFSVGDLIDRGPDSTGAVQLLKQRWFHAVRGNHEHMLLSVVSDADPRVVEVWRRNGGDWGLEGNRANADALAAAPLCEKMPWAITLHHRNGRKFGICHAACPVSCWSDIESVQGNSRLSEEMLWSRERPRQRHPMPVRDVDWTIHGHNFVSEPRRSANALFIDTGCYMPGGTLTVLCLDEFE